MRWTTQAAACRMAVALIGCSQNRNAGGAETGAMGDSIHAGVDRAAR